MPLSPLFKSALVCGWGMLAGYALIAAWIVILGWHIARPHRRHVTIRLLWTFSLLVLGTALLQANLAELNLHGLVVSTYGSIDPVMFSETIFLAKASSSILAGCGMIQAAFTCWAAFLPHLPEDTKPVDDRSG